MSVDTDPNGEIEEKPVDRPPAVGERLWALIPPPLRKDFRVEAALGLRSGVHPETTITRLLLQAGTDPEAVRAACEDAPPASVEAAPAAPPSPKPLRAPAWPYGHPGPPEGLPPLSEIGMRLHAAAGMDPDAAASAERKILRAIAKDPSWVENSPQDLRILGCDVPPAALRVVMDLVEFECRCVIADIRSRARAGDPVARRWMDPRDLFANIGLI